LGTVKLHDESIIIDGVVAALDGWTDNIAQSGVTAFVFSCYGSGVLGTVADHPTDYVLATQLLEDGLQVIKDDPEHFMLARSAADIRRAKQLGKTAIVMYFQNGRPIEDDLGRLAQFHERGVMNMNLTQNTRNFIGDGCLEHSNAGLSNFGRLVVKEMNRLRMLIDLTHAGERTSLEALELSTRPCVISHSNPRRLVDNPRNVTDEQIKRCAEAGGVIGACPWGPISWQGRHETPPGIPTLLQHLEYLVELVGIDHVGIGSDQTITKDPNVVLARSTAYNVQFPEVIEQFTKAFGHTPDTLTIHQPVRAHRFPEVTAALLKRGWTPPDVQKVMGLNFLRVYEEVWGA